MKAIVVKGPWATWIAERRKRIESRTWATLHRGPLLIVAGKAFDDAALFHDDVDDRPPSAFPRGVALCVVDVRHCRPMTKADEPLALCVAEPGRWAWVLGPARKIEPFPVRGQLGLFDVDDKLIRPVEVSAR